jgi:hypothetical protein
LDYSCETDSPAGDHVTWNMGRNRSFAQLLCRIYGCTTNQLVLPPGAPPEGFDYLYTMRDPNSLGYFESAIKKLGYTAHWEDQPVRMLVVEKVDTSTPSGQNAAARGSVIFTSAPSGNPPLSYQWYFNPTNSAQNHSSGPVSGRVVDGPPFVARLNQAEVELVASKGTALSYQWLVNKNAYYAASNLSTGLVNEQMLTDDPPKLQFLAWQDEWQTNRAGAARHPDGSPVTDATEMKWLHDNDTVRMADFSRWNLLPKPRFLDLWFSHPLIDQNTYIEPVLLDARNKVLPCNMPASSISGDAGNQGLGWCQYVLNLNLEPTNLPPHVTVQLHYSIAGPLENLHDIQVQPSSSPLVIISQTNWVVLSIGQDVYGKAFITVGVDGSSMRDRRVGVMAVLKDGRELAASGGGTSYTADKINPQTFTVNEPVADVAKFIIGTRPIRTVEWKDVVLPPN